VTAFGEPTREFQPRIDHGIDLPPEARLRSRQHVHNLGELRRSNDQQVDVACRRAGPGGDRSEQHRGLDPIGQRGESGAEYIGRSHGLLEEAAELAEHRGCPVGLVEDLATPARSGQESGLRQLPGFPLNRPRAGSGQTHQLPQV
jgi:hypothetical protein